MSNTATNEKTPLFAVLIGISSYKTPHPEFRSLRGSVPDAEEFKKFLKEHLSVPSDHIELLTDGKATRSEIIKALKRVKDDKRIKKGDAIFIYYAGHGTEIKPPEHRANGANEKIQAIVPHDCDVEDESGKPIPPIADYMLGILLSKIAEQKGNNITVVLDCCHSGSGTRSVDWTARSVDLPSATLYSEHPDQEILQLETTSRGRSILSDFSHLGLGSHILLAACSHKQVALENNGRGQFSAALLKLLRQVPHNTLRYSDIPRHPSLAHISGQDPQCEGLHADRMLFNAKVPPAERKCFPVFFEGDGRCIVGGGTIHNITSDAEFGIYRKTDTNRSSLICVVRVDSLESSSFTAKLLSSVEFKLDEPIVAVQTKFGNQIRLRVHIPPQDVFRNIYDDMKKNQALENYLENIAVVDASKSFAVKIISPAEGNVKLELYASIASLKKTYSFIHDVELDPTDLAWIFSKMAHFYWELENSHVNERLSRLVKVGFYKLKEDSFPDADFLYADNIFKQVDPDRNLYAKGVIELPARNEDGGKPYGLKLVNYSPLNLHVNIFYFNSYDLTISQWVNSNHSSDLDVLKSDGGSLEIGFGTAGYPPQTFKIANLDLKEELSPFTSTRGMGEYKRKPSIIWADIVIPVILNRYRTVSTRYQSN